METLKVSHPNLDENGLKNVAAGLAQNIQHPKIILLEGNLGMGKSTFARAFIQTLFGENTHVPSPTFTIVQLYENETLKIAHFDLYRLDEEEDELFEIGVPEYLLTHTCLIEWPEKLGSLLPTKNVLRVLIEEGKNDRRDIHIISE